MSPAERAGRAAGLDGLRGLAALSVFLVHIWIYSGSSRPVRDSFWDYALFEMRLAVVFFLLLWGADSGSGVRLVSEGDLPLFALFAQNYSLDTILRFNPVTWTLCLEV